MKQELEELKITKEEVENLTREVEILLKDNSQKFWEISEKLSIIKNSKGYKFISNPNTNEPFRSFEEYCHVFFDIARNTAFNYIKAKDYLEENHPNVHPGEQLDYSKIALLNTIDKSKHFDDWKELDKKVLSNKITKKELEEEIINLKKCDSVKIDLDKTSSYDENIFYLLPKIDKKYDKEVICVDKTRGEEKIRVFKKHYPTVTRFCSFFKNNGIGFSLREYARVQDFPDNFKFLGSSQEIRNQIGEAVSPLMAEYIINKHITGKNYIELFCGCGGFSLGAHGCGKECLWALDVNKYAAYSYKINFPKTEVQIGDIKKINENEIYNRIGKIDFLIGGPPCQGFSTAGLKLNMDEDPRNKLYLEFIKFLKCFRPYQFIMENVPPILKYKKQIISDFEKIGYSVEIEKVNGLNIGMKQQRIRVFFIGKMVKPIERRSK